MRDLGPATTFQDVGEPGEVALDVGMRVGQAVADAGLRREVDDAIEAGPGEQGFHGRAIGQVAADEAEPGERLKTRKAGFLEGDVIVGVEIVEPDDLEAPLEKDATEMEADEAGGPGDQNAHGGTSLIL